VRCARIATPTSGLKILTRPTPNTAGDAHTILHGTARFPASSHPLLTTPTKCVCRVKPEFFVEGLALVRDQFTEAAEPSAVRAMAHVMQGATAVNAQQTKWRFQALVANPSSLTMHFPHPTPPRLRLQWNNAHRGDALRVGICYPPGTRDFRVTRGLFVDNFRRSGSSLSFLPCAFSGSLRASELTFPLRLSPCSPGTKESSVRLQAASDMSSAAFRSGSAFYFDAESRLLFVNFKQRFAPTPTCFFTPPHLLTGWLCYSLVFFQLLAQRDVELLPRARRLRAAVDRRTNSGRFRAILRQLLPYRLSRIPADRSSAATRSIASGP
jgi:hypothetical protein